MEISYTNLNIIEVENHWKTYLMMLKQILIHLGKLEVSIRKPSCTFFSEFQGAHMLAGIMFKLICQRTLQMKCEEFEEMISTILLDMNDTDPNRMRLMQLKQDMLLLIGEVRNLYRDIEFSVRKNISDLQSGVESTHSVVSLCHHIIPRTSKLAQEVYQEIRNCTNKYDDAMDVFETIVNQSEPVEVEKNFIRLVKLCQEVRQMRDELLTHPSRGLEIILRVERVYKEFMAIINKKRLFALSYEELEYVTVMKKLDSCWTRFIQPNLLNTSTTQNKPKLENCLTSLWSKIKMLKGEIRETLNGFVKESRKYNEIFYYLKSLPSNDQRIPNFGDHCIIEMLLKFLVLASQDYHRLFIKFY